MFVSRMLSSEKFHDGTIYRNRTVAVKCGVATNAVIDQSAHCECLWFHVGYPGKSSDARVFKETGVGDFVDGLSPEYHLIGDGAFMMKPYPFEDATEHKSILILN